MMNLSEIYSLHKKGLFALALSILKNSSEAEDAVQDAFMKLAKKNIQPSGDPAAYVFVTVRNAALDRLRKMKKEVDAPEFIFEDERSREKKPGKSLEEEERNFIIRKEIEKLDDSQKEVLIMKLFSELTFEQISEIRNEPLSTVSSRYARTLKSLKSRMETLV